MADAHSTAAPYPMAKPGYGKRSAPGQAPRNGSDFRHLGVREASVATFVDRLPDGAAMDAKSLAAQLPGYGQAACRTALRRLSEAGHLRRTTERVRSEDGTWHWVTRTHFSRTARDDAWWEAVIRGEEQPPPPAAPDRSAAYELLASLSRAEPRLTLSAVECAELEPLAAAWLERGVQVGVAVRVLTDGLPQPVHSAGALVRHRLVNKMPPVPAPAAAPVAGRRPLRLLECTVCRAPGRAEALPGGVCRDCRGETVPESLRSGVHEQVERLRAINRERERAR
ncbi:hypothetical protein ACIHFE_12325 [Streptomyces sp. NPDC052396]|uniref:hypothetical protein n=1 Tax=Streptomyces sp. NPDC052396 TaxID=3365689 RepID=UPI0037CCE4D9